MIEQKLVRLGDTPFGGDWEIATVTGDGNVAAGQDFGVFAKNCLARNRQVFLSSSSFIADGGAPIGLIDRNGNFAWFAKATSSGPIYGLALVDRPPIGLPRVVAFGLETPPAAPPPPGIAGLAHAIVTGVIPPASIGNAHLLGYEGTGTKAPVYFMRGRDGLCELPFSFCADDDSTHLVAQFLGATVEQDAPPAPEFQADQVIGPVPLINWLRLPDGRKTFAGQVIQLGFVASDPNAEANMEQKLEDMFDGK